MLTPNLSLGGAERWVASLVTHSNPNKLQWTGVAVSGMGGVQPDLCAELGHHCPIFGEDIRPTLPDGSQSPAAASADCSRYVNRVGTIEQAIQHAAVDADVLVTWGSLAYRQMLQSALPGMPVVVVSHSSHATPQPVHKQLKTHLVAVSEMAKKPFQFPGNPPISVIYNGAEEKRLQVRQGRRLQRQQWGLDPSHIVLGYIGRQTNEKNPSAAILAVQQLGGPWRAVYYGAKPPGQPGPNLRQLAAKQPNMTIFNQPVINIGDVYAGLDVLMLASHTEAFSLTLLEAWLSRVPVIATPVGSVPELQEKYGQLVFQVPFNPTPAALAQACHLAMLPKQREEVTERAYQLAKEQFTAVAMADRWTSYLRSLLVRRPVMLDL